jgi:hypothetical protein
MATFNFTPSRITSDLELTARCVLNRTSAWPLLGGSLKELTENKSSVHFHGLIEELWLTGESMVSFKMLREFEGKKSLDSRLRGKARKNQPIAHVLYLECNYLSFALGFEHCGCSELKGLM